MDKIRITKVPYIELDIQELNIFFEGVDDAADHLLTYLYTCVGSGTLTEVLDRLFPFEEDLKSAVNHRLGTVMKKAARKLGHHCYD